MTESPPLLEVRDLRVEYRRGFRVPALVANDGISVHIAPGETLGVVGESGSGKSTLGDAVLGFAPVASGRVLFKGEDITRATPRRRRGLTKNIQVIFQNPYGSLNPSTPIGQTLAEPLSAHKLVRGEELRRRVTDWLETVGLPADAASRYPSDFSGGQRQRIAIARALLVEPELVVCDEAVSALDLSIQAQILNLLMDLQQRTGVSYLFITHDMAVVEHVSDRIAVLYKGRIVEEGTAAQVVHAPTAAYTKALIAAAPSPDPREQRERRRVRTAP